MALRRPRFQWQDVAGEPVRVGGVTVTPHAHLLTIGLPFAGLVWQHPSYALVEHDGQVDRLPIVDVTRRIQLGLLALSVVVIVASRLGAPGRQGGSSR